MNDDKSLLNHTKLNQNTLLVLSNTVLSGLGTWLELSDMSDTVIYITFYQAFTTLKNRSSLLFLLKTLVQLSSAADHNVFTAVHKALTNPFDFKKTESRFSKDPEKKEKKLPVPKLSSVEKFFEDVVKKETSLLGYVLNLAIEENSSLLFEFINSIFKSLLQYMFIMVL